MTERIETDEHVPWARRMLFVSGRVSLDLAHTGGPGAYGKFERLHTPADLSTWVAHSPLRLTNRSYDETDLQQARDLRWAIWCAANAVRLGEPVAAGDLALLNRTAAAPPLAPELDPMDLGLSWSAPHGWESVASAIARDAITLLSEHPDVAIQQCANPTCPLLFVDSSRPGKRRWCSMGRCGNLAKTARHRNRQTSAPPNGQEGRRADSS